MPILNAARPVDFHIGHLPLWYFGGRGAQNDDVAPQNGGTSAHEITAGRVTVLHPSAMAHCGPKAMCIRQRNIENNKPSLCAVLTTNKRPAKPQWLLRGRRTGHSVGETRGWRLSLQSGRTPTRARRPETIAGMPNGAAITSRDLAFSPERQTACSLSGGLNSKWRKQIAKENRRRIAGVGIRPHGIKAPRAWGQWKTNTRCGTLAFDGPRRPARQIYASGHPATASVSQHSPAMAACGCTTKRAGIGFARKDDFVQDYFHASWKARRAGGQNFSGWPWTTWVPNEDPAFTAAGRPIAKAR